jgi:beta-glucosidase
VVLMLGTNNIKSDSAAAIARADEKLPAANFGIGGDRTQHVLWRVTNGELEGIAPKVVVLMLGTNNIKSDSAAAIARADEKLVQTIRNKLPGTKILLLGIFPRAHRTDDPAANIPAKVKAVNAELARLDDGKTVRYLDLADKLAPDGKEVPEYYTDGVHLTAKGYEAWADAIEPTLGDMMK